MRLAVVGNPISHSRSPLMHTAAMANETEWKARVPVKKKQREHSAVVVAYSRPRLTEKINSRSWLARKSAPIDREDLRLVRPPTPKGARINMTVNRVM